jgi:hypothetical protein
METARVETNEKRPPDTMAAFLQRSPWPARVRWFLAEFLIVVCGILAALALTAWWESRQNSARELAFLRQLEVDLNISQRQLDSAADFFYVRAAAAAAVSRAFWSPTAPNPDSLASWLGPPLASRRARPVVGTATALVSSGELNLIRDDSIRSAILTYLENSAATLENIRRFDETYFRDAVRMVPQFFDFDAFREEQGAGGIVDRDCAGQRLERGSAAELIENFGRTGVPMNAAWCNVVPIPAGARRPPFARDLATILNNPDAYYAYRSLLTAHRNQATQYALLSQETQRLRNTIRAELAQRGR